MRSSICSGLTIEFADAARRLPSHQALANANRYMSPYQCTLTGPRAIATGSIDGNAIIAELSDSNSWVCVIRMVLSHGNNPECSNMANELAAESSPYLRQHAD